MHGCKSCPCHCDRKQSIATWLDSVLRESRLLSPTALRPLRVCSARLMYSCAFLHYAQCLWVGEKRGKVLILCRSHPSGKPVVVLGPHW